jgi:hypothetical protein
MMQRWATLTISLSSAFSGGGETSRTRSIVRMSFSCLVGMAHAIPNQAQHSTASAINAASEDFARLK